MIYELKIDKTDLAQLESGDKKAVVLNDQGYQKGDILKFWYYDNQFDFLITFVHSKTGMTGNYVVLSLEEKK